MDRFVTVSKPASLAARASRTGTKGTSEATSEVLIPYSRASSSSAITKHLLATLSDEANPITHSKAGTKPVDYVDSTATGHQRAESRIPNRKLYFENRAKKIEHQQSAPRADSSSSAQKRVLQNVRVYINGYLSDTTDIEMKRIVTLAGGTILQTASGATHILTSQGLNGSKTHKHLTTKSRNIVHVVKPEWVTECIKAGKRLPERNFAVIKDHTMQSLNVMFANSRS